VNIGLDYDDTYTRDPMMWNSCLRYMRAHKHKVYIVTWRTQGESVDIIKQLEGMVDGVFCTARKAKQPFMFAQGICIDVWIDDNPSAILHTMEGW
jgi:hypothetical protein